MILNLIDRCVRPGGASCSLDVAASKTVLRELAARIGKKEWLVNLVLVEDQEMAELNATYRGQDGVTDVLSFSYLTAPEGQKPDLRRGQCYAPADLILDPLIGADAEDQDGAVGELILAPCFIGARCQQRQWNPDHEVALLVVHGCLHILGWEHGEPFAREAMQVIEEGILADSGIPHPMRNQGAES